MKPIRYAMGWVVPFLVLPSLALLERSMACSPPPSPSLPDTPAAGHFAGWLAAFNGARADEMAAFIASHYDQAALQRRPVAERAAVLRSLQRHHPHLQVDEIAKSSAHEISVLAHSDLTDSRVQITLRVAPEAPHGITEIRLQPARGSSLAGARPRLSDQEIVRQLGAYLQRLSEADLFSGTVLLARNGQPLFHQAYGLASKGFHVPNQLDTKFNLGSMNKMFTAVAVAQLVEQGKLDFHEHVGTYLPDYPNKDVAQKVTLHHLLTHTSGIGDYFTEEFDKMSKDRFRKIDDFLPLFVNKPLAFEPGQRFQYSNAGFMLLGAIVEKVTGQSYFDYVREHIYRPAGMVNTDAYEMDHDTPNLALGYTEMNSSAAEPPGQRRNNLFLHVVKGGPAGGGFSTAPDLLKFDQALRHHRLLSPASTDLVLTGKVDPDFGPGVRYAYGFEDDRADGFRIVGHSGGFPGINSQLDVYLDQGYTVVVLSNYDPPAAMNVANKLRDLLCRK